MTTLIQYLQRVLIVAIPAVLVFLCFTPYRMKALSAMNLHTSRKHEAGLILFVTSIFGVLALTLWPTYTASCGKAKSVVSKSAEPIVFRRLIFSRFSASVAEKQSRRNAWTQFVYKKCSAEVRGFEPGSGIIEAR